MDIGRAWPLRFQPALPKEPAAYWRNLSVYSLGRAVARSNRPHLQPSHRHACVLWHDSLRWSSKPKHVVQTLKHTGRRYPARPPTAIHPSGLPLDPRLKTRVCAINSYQKQSPTARWTVVIVTMRATTRRMRCRFENPRNPCLHPRHQSRDRILSASQESIPATRTRTEV